MTAEVATSFQGLGMPYTKAELDGVRALFDQYPSLTVENIHDLLTFGVDFGTGKLLEAPAKGHDFYFFRRRVKTAKQFLRYLSQLVCEMYLNDWEITRWDYHPVTKVPMLDYWEMEQPFWDIAFADNKTPIAWDHFTVEVEKPELGTIWRDGRDREFLTGRNVSVATTRIKPVFYDEWVSGEYDPSADQDIYSKYTRCYEEMLTLPMVDEEWPEPVQYDRTTMKEWEREHGTPQFIERSEYYDSYKARVVQSEKTS